MLTKEQFRIVQTHLDCFHVERKVDYISYTWFGRCKMSSWNACDSKGNVNLDRGQLGYKYYGSLINVQYYATFEMAKEAIEEMLKEDCKIFPAIYTT